MKPRVYRKPAKVGRPKAERPREHRVYVGLTAEEHAALVVAADGEPLSTVLRELAFLALDKIEAGEDFLGAPEEK